MMLPIIFFIFSLLIGLSNAAIIPDFCIADKTLPETPSGYPCKNMSKVTIDDFIYSGFGLTSYTITNNISNSNSTPVFDTQFPALNGLGVATTRIDIAVGGFVLLHSHPRAHEVVTVFQGQVIAGFVASTSVAYYRTLNKGDVILFPQGLNHFLINTGNTSAISFSAFSNSNPGLQTVNYVMFSNSLPSDLIDKISMLDDAQVKKLKRIFGGTN